MVGFSLKTKSAPSRAPAASITADNMRRDVSVNSRSAVSSGPRSERASTVRNSLRKLLVSTIDEWSENAEQNERNTQEQPQGEPLLVSLVLKIEAVYESDSDPSVE
jgi:Arc/MetJ-type ribon-helix-helix transcriptional regulator